MAKFGKVYKYLSAKAVKEALIVEIKESLLSKNVIATFKEAWDSKFWEDKGYDAASLVSDEYHPRLANFFHDYMWRSGTGGQKADTIYRELLIATGTNKTKAWARYLGIRVVWLGWYKWKHRKKGNVVPLSSAFEKLYKEFS